jgi:hypothetical protein
MTKKVSVRLKIAPLQRVIAEPIMGPAEQAALDKAPNAKGENRPERL